MSLITVEGLSLQFGGRVLFDDVGFAISADDRVGLVGRNGMGKTSLLRAIMHELQPDAGKFRVARGVRIGYLVEDASFNGAGRDIAGPLGLQLAFQNDYGRVWRRAR